MADKGKKKAKKPANHASPVSGTEPPAEYRWKPGESGNPSGRPPAGLKIKEHINLLANSELTEAQVRKIARDPGQPWTRRAAAERIIRTLEAPDISDFAGLLRGENDLEDLRAMGINTEAIKKFKQRVRSVPRGDGNFEEVIDREIELHDRAGPDFDRILDRTAGRPNQAVQITGGDGGAVVIKLQTELEKCGREFENYAAIRRMGEGILPSNGNGESLSESGN